MPTRSSFAPILLAPLLASALAATPARVAAQELPPDEASARAVLNASPRHGEWVTYDAGGGDKVSAWVVYPQRSDPAPVVVVIHEIFGMSDWVHGVADRLAAEGFIAVAPDLLSGHGPGGGGTESLGDRQAVVEAIRDLPQEEVDRRLKAAAAYGTSLPAASKKVGVVGFCWGGTTSFQFATADPDLDAAVVYYGTAPEGGYDNIGAPVLAFYGGSDNRVTSTLPTSLAAMQRLGKSFHPEVFEGAGHAFLRVQDGQDGANMLASQKAWPMTLAFFREHLEK